MTKESKLHVESLSVPRTKPFEHDEVTNPKHYQGSNGLEVIDVHRNFLTGEELRGYYKGNILKYILRERNKNGLVDLKKARRHLDWLIGLEENHDTH